MEKPAYQRAEETADIVRRVLGRMEFYVFGSFARKHFDSTTRFGEGSDLDILLGNENFDAAISRFSPMKELGKLEIVSARKPQPSTNLRAARIDFPLYTPIHLVGIQDLAGTVSMASQIMTKDGVKYLKFAEKSEFESQVRNNPFLDYAPNPFQDYKYDDLGRTTKNPFQDYRDFKNPFQDYRDLVLA